MAADPATRAQGSDRPTVSFGMALPQGFGGDAASLAAVRRFIARAEELSFHGLWTEEAVIGRGMNIEPLSMLTYAAALTERVRLGCAMLLLPLRVPVTLARATAAVDNLSGGRLDLGVALGDNRRLVGSVGLDPSWRIDRFVENVAVLRALWSGKPATINGRTLSIDDWIIRPRPVQQPGPPIWFGGRHPAALRRAVALGDGWIGGGGGTIADFEREVAIVREELRLVGRDQASFGIGRRLYLAVSDRPDTIRGRVREWFGDYYGDEKRADRVAVVGDAATVASAIDKVVGFGARLVILHPVVDMESQLETLAHDVIPLVHATPATPGSTGA